MKLGILPAFDRNTITNPDWVVEFLELAARYRDAGVSRIVISAQEAGGTSHDDYRRLIESVQEKVIAKL